MCKRDTAKCLLLIAIVTGFIWWCFEPKPARPRTGITYVERF